MVADVAQMPVSIVATLISLISYEQPVLTVSIFISRMLAVGT
jgi:hypothetical protein